LTQQGNDTKEKSTSLVSFIPFVFKSEIGPSDIALFQYTGGTTASPKPPWQATATW